MGDNESQSEDEDFGRENEQQSENIMGENEPPSEVEDLDRRASSMRWEAEDLDRRAIALRRESEDLDRPANALRWQVEALYKWANALRCVAEDLERRASALRSESVSKFHRDSGVKRIIRVPAVSANLADIPSDEFSWLKLTQMTILGHPYPISYYRCRTVGCPARKHIERALDDRNVFIVYYDG